MTWTWDHDSSVIRALDSIGLPAVTALIGCLDDSTQSRTMLDGRPLRVGLVCYDALRSIVLVESAVKWNGDLDPTASLYQLQRAKLAWETADHEFWWNYRK